MGRGTGTSTHKKSDKKLKKDKSLETSSAAAKNDEISEIVLDDSDDDETHTAVNDADEDHVQPSLRSRSSRRKLLLFHNRIQELGWDQFRMVELKHPKTNISSKFLLNISKTDGKQGFLYEMLTMEQETRSWFLNNSVVTDGNLYTCTPVDPLFFVLTTMYKSNQGKPLRDHLCEWIDSPKIVTKFVDNLEASQQVSCIANRVVCDDIIAYKYSEDKALKWLGKKLDRVAKFLIENDIGSYESCISSNFARTNKSSSSDDRKEDSTRYAAEIIGEYLVDEIKQKFFALHNIPFSKPVKRKQEDSSPSKSKKIKFSDENNPVEDYGTSSGLLPLKQAAKVSAKQKEFQKAAKGSQSLFKFFSSATK